MANIVGLDLNIDQNFLADAVKQTVLIGIAESLNGKNEIVSQVVNAVLSQKVDREGKVSSYTNDNKFSLIEYHVNKLLSEEVKQTIIEIVNEQREDIKKIIREAFQKKHFTDQVVEAVMSGTINQLGRAYNTKVVVSLNDKDLY